MPGSFHLEGVDAFNRQDYVAARDFFLQAVAENSAESETFYLLGKSYFFCDQKSEAIDSLKQYVASEQDNPEQAANVAYAFDLLGQCYEACEQDNNARICYRAATKIYPGAASAWHNLGLLRTKLAGSCLDNSFDLLRKAYACLQCALKICDTNPMFLHSLASWYEQYAEALGTLAPAEHILLAIDKNFKSAIHYYQQALAACYQDDVMLRNIITINFTECLAQYGHYLYQTSHFTEAREYYLQAIALNPKHLAVINQIGMCFFKQGAYPEAREYFAAILEKTGKSNELADAWLNIACTHRLEKSWDDAKAALKMAKDLAPEDPAISDEEQQLMDSIAQASLVVCSQIMFVEPAAAASDQSQEPQSSLDAALA